MHDGAPLRIRQLTVRAPSRAGADAAVAALRSGLDGLSAPDAAPVSLHLNVSSNGNPGQTAAQALRQALTGGQRG